MDYYIIIKRKRIKSDPWTEDPQHLRFSQKNWGTTKRARQEADAHTKNLNRSPLIKAKRLTETEYNKR